MPAGALRRLGSVRLRHPASINNIFFADGGRVPITDAEDNTTRFWIPTTTQKGNSHH